MSPSTQPVKNNLRTRSSHYLWSASTYSIQAAALGWSSYRRDLHRVRWMRIREVPASSLECHGAMLHGVGGGDPTHVQEDGIISRMEGKQVKACVHEALNARPTATLAHQPSCFRIPLHQLHGAGLVRQHPPPHAVFAPCLQIPHLEHRGVEMREPKPPAMALP